MIVQFVPTSIGISKIYELLNRKLLTKIKQLGCIFRNLQGTIEVLVKALTITRKSHSNMELVQPLS